MPRTVCAKCGGQWDHPSGWFAHLGVCSPARQREVVTAMQGLTMAMTFTSQGQGHVDYSGPQAAR